MKINGRKDVICSNKVLDESTDESNATQCRPVLYGHLEGKNANSN